MYHTISDELMTETMRDLARLAIGFEPTFRRLNKPASQTGYPPFNLERLDEHSYRITVAVAGFKMEDLDVTVADNQLTVTGDIKNKDDDRIFLHKGIAGRSFARSFVLADHVNVISASLENGMLTIDLQQEIPEALKPRKIAINNNSYLDSSPLSFDDK